MPEIVPFDKKKFCQIDVKIVVQPNDPPESSVRQLSKNYQKVGVILENNVV